MPTSIFNVVLLAVGGVPILFQSASLSAQWLYAGYDPIRDAISSLVMSPFGWLQTVVFYLFGVSLIVLAAAVYFHVKVRFKEGVIGIALLGAAFTMVGAHPAINSEISHLTLAIHRGAATFIVTAFPFACFMLVPMLKRTGHTRLLIYTIASGVFAALFLTIGGLTLVNQMSLVGLYERVLLLNGQIWVTVICVQMMITNKEPNTARAVSS